MNETKTLKLSIGKQAPFVSLMPKLKNYKTRGFGC